MKSHSSFLLKLFFVLALGTLAQLTLSAQPIFTTESKFTASDPSSDDGFGGSVAVAGNAVAAGAPFDDDLGFDSGSAYVFRRAQGGWFEQKLTAPDGQAFDGFGIAVAIEGDLVVVGSRGADSEAASGSGAAYVFTWDGARWNQEAKLTPSDPVIGGSFGQSVALNGDTLAIGAYQALDENGTNSGAVYVFVRTATTWTQQAKLTAFDGWAGAFFGLTIGLSGDTLVTSAFSTPPSGVSGTQGAYVFVREGGNWSLQAKLTGATSRFGAFGFAVDVSGDTVAVSDYLDSEAVSLAGAVFLYERSGRTWTLQEKVTTSDASAQAFFGRSVSLQSNMLLAGAVGANAAYVFRRSGGNWSEAQKLIPSDGVGGDSFGASVDLTASAALVGAPQADMDFEANVGAAYLYERGAQQ